MKTATQSLLSTAFMVALVAFELPSPVDAQGTCFFKNKSRKEGESLTADDFSCTCGPGGNWVDCLRNEDKPYAPSSANTIEGIVFNSEDFTTLNAALEAAELYGVLDGAGPFTVFAPTDEAFKKLPKGVLSYLLKKPETLGEVLKYHVIAGAKVRSNDLSANQKVNSFSGEKLDIRAGCLKSRTVTVPCPPCGGWQVCGCTPSKRSECLDNGVEINGGTRVIKANVNADNGIVHVIDTVLVPPSLTEAVKTIAEEATKITIQDVVVASDQFTTLEKAIKKADLLGVLDGEGPFTVFAPTDRAFAKVPDPVIKYLLANPLMLADVLKYHVVDPKAGKVRSGALPKGQSEANTLLGEKVQVDKQCFDDDCKQISLAINDSYVVTPNVEAFNGIIHILDSVLIPPSLQGAVNDLLKTST